MKLKKKEEGITLITLAVTIVVITILLTVTITQLTSDDKGIVDKAMNETQYHEEAIENEQRKINEVTQNQMEDWGL